MSQEKLELFPGIGVIPTFVFLCGYVSGDNATVDTAQDAGMGIPIVQS
jgi:hypothetical protein